jgi:hypothetical protein
MTKSKAFSIELKAKDLFRHFLLPGHALPKVRKIFQWKTGRNEGVVEERFV